MAFCTTPGLERLEDSAGAASASGVHVTPTACTPLSTTASLASSKHREQGVCVELRIVGDVQHTAVDGSAVAGHSLRQAPSGRLSR